MSRRRKKCLEVTPTQLSWLTDALEFFIDRRPSYLPSEGYPQVNLEELQLSRLLDKLKATGQDNR